MIENKKAQRLQVGNGNQAMYVIKVPRKLCKVTDLRLFEFDQDLEVTPLKSE